MLLLGQGTAIVKMTPQELGSPTLDLHKTMAVNSQSQIKQELLDELLDSGEGTVIFSYVPNGEPTRLLWTETVLVKNSRSPNKSYDCRQGACRERCQGWETWEGGCDSTQNAFHVQV